MKSGLFIRFLLCLSMLVLALPVKAQEGSCQEWIAALKAREGRVETQLAKKVFWSIAILEDTYCFGDKLRTFERSRATVLLRDKSYLRLNQNTITGFPEYKGKEKFSLINLIKGAVFFRSRVPRRLEVETPFVNAVIKGTEFLVVVKEDEAQVTVFEGVVETTNKHGQLTLNKGETAIAKVNQSPRRHILVKPKNAVQWALYYPPVIDFRIPPSDPAVSNLESALDAYRAGNLSTAFDVLDRIPEGQRSNTYFTLRSGLLLTVGRVDEAQPDIARVLAENPGDVNAISLKSIIAVAQNDNDEAFVLAEKAVNTDPQSAPALIALSYAQQAQFELEAARESLEKAVELAPDDALAWARLAELQLSFGDLDSALEAAEKAVSLNPNLERTQSVLGFAALTQIDIDKAKAAFEKAIRFDPAAPLPRLGLGLAKIRQGDLDEGTEDMEIAASLDPDNSLIRSYLGKAFYEKKDKRWAGKELAMAKELDPKDPTPWFYDAILKQTMNRPVEALHDMQKAIELNDNRAVYRSRLRLDEDQAARNTSLARPFTDIGFNRTASLEAYNSLAHDQTNWSAHRFLSDSYIETPRHEIARTSELLQSQLLQPLSSNPVPPRLAFSDVNIVAGGSPFAMGFNELTALFDSDKIRLTASAFGGNNDTLGNETILSGLYNKIAYSFGQFHSSTDGFRENSNVRNDLYNAFVQFQATPDIDFQAEYRRRDTRRGDIEQRFDLENFSSSSQQEIDQDIGRFGAHFTLSPNSDLIGTVVFTDLDATTTNRSATTESSIDGYQGEAQHIFHSEWINLVTGGRCYDLAKDSKTTTNTPRFSFVQRAIQSDIDQCSAYMYGNVNWPFEVFRWTAGFSYDSYEVENTGSALSPRLPPGPNGLPQSAPVDVKLRVNKFNPKLGFQWQLAEDIKLRMAYFKSVKLQLPTDQTIEQTHVAGFNQLYDDFNGTRAEFYGVGLNGKAHDHFFFGVEAFKRKLDTPNLAGSEYVFDVWTEKNYRAYSYWVIDDNWIAAIEPRFEQFRLKHFASPSFPPSIDTVFVPLSLRYFNHSGFFAKFKATFVHQDVDLVESGSSIVTSPFAPITPMIVAKDEDFVVVDTAIGYRFPNRWGMLNLEVNNLFNRKFRFHDDNFRSGRKRIAEIIPDRTFVASLTVSF